MRFDPHEYQTYAIKRIEDNDNVGLFLDMGLGKTVVTLTAIDNLIKDLAVSKVLVIAPLQTAWNTWTTEQKKWDHLKDLRISLVLGDAKKRRAALKADADVYVINRENTQWLCDECGKSWPFDMLVVDELSSFKNASAKRFKALRKQLPYFYRTVGLTGTPASNGYIDLWPEVYLLDRGERLGKSLGQYRQTFFHPGRGNGQIVYEWKLNSGAKDAIDERLSDLCVSMKSVDFIKMPERIDSELFVQMDEKERKVYDQFGKDHIVSLEGVDIVSANAATLSGKLLQMASGFVYETGTENVVDIHRHKLEALEELKEAAQGQSLLVYYEFVEDKRRILGAFKDAVELKGRKEIESWNAGRIPMLVCHPASAGHGLNLQDGGHIVVWYGLPWSLELYQQANARLYRQGQKETVMVYHLLTKDTYDEDVLKAIKNKDATQEALLAALKARIKEWERDTTQ